MPPDFAGLVATYGPMGALAVWMLINSRQGSGKGPDPLAQIAAALENQASKFEEQSAKLDKIDERQRSQADRLARVEAILEERQDRSR